MRFKDYVWPHNPRTYTIDYERKMAVQKLPFGSYRLQDLGLNRRVMRGEGEFVGEGAYQEFQKLASVFYLPGPGVLVHPVWQVTEAHFVELSLRQEPRADYVSYTFTFWECPAEETEGLTSYGGGKQGGEVAAETAVYHRVSRGESLWGIARDYGIALTDLIGLNPQIKNPNLIVAGERVRVR